MPDGSIGGYLIGFLLLLFASAYFSASEMSLSSVSKIHMMTAADNGKRGASRALYLLEHFDETLTALLIGNNLVNIAFATLATVVASRLSQKALGVTPALAATMATLVSTVVIVFFGEIIPKCYAKACNESFTMATSGILLFITKLLWPFSKFFSAIGRVLTRPFLKNVKEEPTVTEDELKDMVDSIVEGENDFDEDTAELVQSAMKFADLTVRDVMIEWDRVFKISTGMKTAEILEALQNCGHSRVPVVGRDGSCKGVLRIRSFFKAYVTGRKNVVLAGVMDRPFYASPDKSLDDMLTLLSSHRRNLAVVRDKAGTLLGVVTVEDILEKLVGQISDESDREEQQDE